MRQFLVILVIAQTIIIIGGGIFIYKNFIAKKDDKEGIAVDEIIKKEIKLPKDSNKIETVSEKKSEQVIKESITPSRSDSLRAQLQADTQGQMPIPLPPPSTTEETKSQIVEQPQVSDVKKETKKQNPTDIKINVDIDNIDIPKVQEIGGGLSASGAFALQQAYEEAHDLNRTLQLANDILKSNPNDETAKKYKRLAELEIMANDALNRGDRQSALNYFYQMQSIDPNNKWAKKGIVKIMSGG